MQKARDTACPGRSRSKGRRREDVESVRLRARFAWLDRDHHSAGLYSVRSLHGCPRAVVSAVQISKYRRFLMRSVRLALALGVLLLLPALGNAQTLAGVVKDSSGAVLPGVTVEAASPALIEKVRATTTDAAGQYKIDNLRVGTYSLTFTLTGFNTIKREGIELSGSGTVAISTDMKVGAIAETITVTGANPIVDVHSATRQ